MNAMPASQITNPHANQRNKAPWEEHAARAVTLFGIGQTATEGATARVIFTLLVGAANGAIPMAEAKFSEYIDNKNKREKRKDLDLILDNFFGYNHTDKNDLQPAPSKFRQMVTAAIPVVSYLIQRMRTWTETDANGVTVRKPLALCTEGKDTDYGVGFKVRKPGQHNEQFYLALPARMLFDSEKDHKQFDEPRIVLDNSNNAMSLARLYAKARKFHNPADAEARDTDDAMVKAAKTQLGHVQFAPLLQYVGDQISRMAMTTPDIFNKEHIKGPLGSLVAAAIAVSGTATEDRGDITGPLADTLRTIQGLQYHKSNPKVLALVAEIYDAVDAVSKDRALYDAMYEAQAKRKAEIEAARHATAAPVSNPPAAPRVVESDNEAADSLAGADAGMMRVQEEGDTAPSGADSIAPMETESDEPKTVAEARAIFKEAYDGADFRGSDTVIEDILNNASVTPVLIAMEAWEEEYEEKEAAARGEGVPSA